MIDIGREVVQSTLINSLDTRQENAGGVLEVNKRPDEIDRLSLLPNELLDHIFDLAYDIDSPSTGALSKRLLPFHIIGIYRRIHISVSSSLKLLVSRIGSRLELGALVEALEIDCCGLLNTQEPFPPKENSFRFFTSLTRLKSFVDHGPTSVLLDFFNDSRFDVRGLLPKLVHLETTPFCKNRPLAAFTMFPSLTNLTIKENTNHILESLASVPSLPFLVSLTVESNVADQPLIADFCRLSPSLTKLFLSSYNPNYHAILPLLPISLTLLSLDNLDSDRIAVSFDHHLARFVNLKQLYLGDYLFTNNIGRYLVDLTRLEELGLDRGSLLAGGINALFEGPTRLPSLRRLELNLDFGDIGSRWEFGNDDMASIGTTSLQEALPASNWILPCYYYEDGSGQGREIEEVIKMAEKNGITVEGTIRDAIRTVDAYELEIANLAVYQARLTKDLERLHRQQIASKNHPHSRFPSLDFDSLDPNNLKLVKTDLPDEGWFSLTLENG